MLAAEGIGSTGSGLLVGGSFALIVAIFGIAYRQLRDTGRRADGYTDRLERRLAELEDRLTAAEHEADVWRERYLALFDRPHNARPQET